MNKPQRRISLREMLESVNTDVNSRIDYVADIESGEEDYWQSPQETWSLETGDCEDIAIAKYYALKGSRRFDDTMLRLAFVNLNGKGHLVLLATIPVVRRSAWWKLWERPVEFSDTFVLDNANDALYRLDETRYEVKWWINDCDYTIVESGIRYAPAHKPQWAAMRRRAEGVDTNGRAVRPEDQSHPALPAS